VPAPADAAQGRAALVALLRDEGPGVLATLGRQLASLPLAEDALQDAAVRALEVWPREGVPASPRGWLLLTARRRALDVLRREARRVDKEAASVKLLPPPEEEDSPVEDDLLRLLFTCCHPALDRSAQVALALKWLCGLSTGQVGRLLLVPEAAMARRLSRARQKIAVARIPYRVPAAEQLPDRVAGVLATVHLLFTEGYSATGPGQALHGERAGEALRLARLLRRLLPDDAGTCGLLALVLLHSARRPARTGPDGGLVLLRDQDRALWSRPMLEEGVALLGEGLARTPGGPTVTSCRRRSRPATASLRPGRPRTGRRSSAGTTCSPPWTLPLSSSSTARSQSRSATARPPGWRHWKSSICPATRCCQPPAPSCSPGWAGRPRRPLRCGSRWRYRSTTRNGGCSGSGSRSSVTPDRHPAAAGRPGIRPATADLHQPVSGSTRCRASRKPIG